MRCSPVSSGISKAQAGFWEYITTYLILFSCKRTKGLVVVCWLGACDDSFFGELKTNALNRRFLLLTSLRRDSFGVVLSFGMPVCIKAPRACTICFYLWLLFSRIRSVFFGLPWPAESILLSSYELICLFLDTCSFHLLVDSLSTKVWVFREWGGVANVSASLSNVWDQAFLNLIRNGGYCAWFCGTCSCLPRARLTCSSIGSPGQFLAVILLKLNVAAHHPLLFMRSRNV